VKRLAMRFRQAYPEMGRQACPPHRNLGTGRLLARGVRQAQGGFTLLEVLIALVILGIAVAAIFDLLQVGLLSAEASAGYSKAAFYGHAKMGELLTKMPIEPGQDNGSFDDGYSYSTRVELYEMPTSTESTGSMESDVPQGADVYLLDVTIGIPNQTRKLHLQTLRAVPKQQQAAQ
jgi:general secretion pathway protein I